MRGSSDKKLSLITSRRNRREHLCDVIFLSFNIIVTEENKTRSTHHEEIEYKAKRQ